MLRRSTRLFHVARSPSTRPGFLLFNSLDDLIPSPNSLSALFPPKKPYGSQSLMHSLRQSSLPTQNTQSVPSLLQRKLIASILLQNHHTAPIKIIAAGSVRKHRKRKVNKHKRLKRIRRLRRRFPGWKELFQKYPPIR